MKRQVQSLNAAGIDHFSAWLKNPDKVPPLELLDNSQFCEDIGQQYFIDSSRVFDTSYALGKYLHEEVFASVTDVVSHSSASGMWAWLSLVFVQSLLSRGSVRKNKPLDLPHYIELQGQLGRRVSYRLITRTAWRLVRLHGDLAEIALGSKRSPWGEMAEQMTSRQEIFSHRAFWSVAYRLYRTTSGELRRGATSQRPASARKDPTNKAGRGAVRRLSTTFRQFDRTFLTRTMSLEQMLEVLPVEYQRWVD